MELLRRNQIELAGKRAVVLGRSEIVGKPMALLLLHADATVTVCHSRTRDLEAVTREADVLVAAIGRAGLVRGAHVKPGAVVVDVGMNRVSDPALARELSSPSGSPSSRSAATCSSATCTPSVAAVAGALTPVPGGVGPLTIAMLMANTVRAAPGRGLSRPCSASASPAASRPARRRCAAAGGARLPDARPRPGGSRRGGAGQRGARRDHGGLRSSGRSKPTGARPHGTRRAGVRRRRGPRAAQRDRAPAGARAGGRWAAARPKGAVLVTDAALLVETGSHLRFDRLVVVHCEPGEQLPDCARATASTSAPRGRGSRADARRREAGIRALPDRQLGGLGKTPREPPTPSSTSSAARGA